MIGHPVGCACNDCRAERHAQRTLANVPPDDSGYDPRTPDGMAAAMIARHPQANWTPEARARAANSRAVDTEVALHEACVFTAVLTGANGLLLTIQ